MLSVLEKKAKKNIIQSIDKIVTNSFLILMFDMLTMRYYPSLKNVLKDKDIKNIYNSCISLICNLKDIIESGETNKMQYLQECLKHKSALLDIYGVVKIYLSVCNIIDISISSANDESKSSDLSKIGVLLRENVSRFMDKAREMDLEEQAAAMVLTVLPNYFDDAELITYIVNSAETNLKFAPKSEALRHIKNIKRSLAPTKMPDYGRYFKKYGDSLFEMYEAIRLSNFDIKSMDSKYEELYTQIDEVADTISSLYSIISFLSIIIGSLHPFDSITNNNNAYKEYYSKTVELLNSATTDEQEMDDLLSSLDISIEKEMTALVELTKRKELIFKNANVDSFSEQTKALFSMEFYQMTMFYENLDDTAEDFFDMTFDDECASPSVSKKELKNLELAIRESTLGMNEEMKAAARRNLFLNVNMVTFFTKNEVLDYVDKMLTMPVKRYEIEASNEAVEQLLKEDVLSTIEFIE